MLTIAFVVVVAFASDLAVEQPQVEDPTYWTRGSVVYAEVINVDIPEHGMDKVTLRPLATLSGTVDAAHAGEIHATTWIGSLVSGIHVPPKQGAKVLAIIEFAERNGKLAYTIPNGGAVCFPTDRSGGRPCLLEVTGFDDPKVTETIENLRKLRGRQREEAEKAKADAEKAKAEKPKAAQNPAAEKK